MTIPEKYDQRAQAIDSLLCVGLDSDLSRLPQQFLSEENPQWSFNRHVIDRTHPYAAAFKINTAFYEAQGVLGWQAMLSTVAYLRAQHPDILTICDAKRADIGNTSTAYAHAIFDELGFDAVTLQPYLGQDALQPFLDRQDKGCIILCRTSNPGSGEFQSLNVNGRPLWQHIAEQVRDHWNFNQNCMLVVGATYPDELRAARQTVGDMTLLVPGVGSQGGDVTAVIQAGSNSDGRGLIINASRSIISADDPAEAAADTQQAINAVRNT